jgi:hypothetical protein
MGNDTLVATGGPDNDPSKRPRGLSFFLSCLFVDLIAQGLMSWWFTFINNNLFHLDVNMILFWIGSALLYTGFHMRDVTLSGKVLFWHINAFFLLTIYIFIFIW